MNPLAPSRTRGRKWGVLDSYGRHTVFAKPFVLHTQRERFLNWWRQPISTDQTQRYCIHCTGTTKVTHSTLLCVGRPRLKLLRDLRLGPRNLGFHTSPFSCRPGT